MDISGFESPTEIGRGGFGVVYRAAQPGFERDVAIKVLSVSAATLDERSRRRFETETATTGRLSGHPHIITLHQAGFTDAGQPYLVMAFMGGGSLGERLRRSGPLRWQEAVEITVRIAGALATAHAAGIVHRDVKPDNILVDDFGAPVLSDFGIASVTSSGSVTAPGQLTATLAYSPPEVLDGGRPDTLADVFAMASTAFALITGHPPFSRMGDESFAQVLARMMREDAPDLEAYGVPAPVASALRQGLARDPAARTHSVIALGQDLQAAQRQLGMSETAMVLPAGSGAGAPDEQTLALPLDLRSTGQTSEEAAATPTERVRASTTAVAPQVAARPQGRRAAPDQPRGRGIGWTGVLLGVLLLAVLAAGAVAWALRAEDGRDVAAAPSDGPSTVPVPLTASTDPATEPLTATPTPAAEDASVRDLSGHPVGPNLAATLTAWVGGINAADYQRAFNAYTPRLRDAVTFETFREGNATSQIAMPRVLEVREQGEALVAIVAFRSTQRPALGTDGQACSDWNISWTMLQGASGRWQVDAVENLSGSPATC